MDKTVVYAIVVFGLLGVGGYFGYALRGKCPEADPTLIEAITKEADGHRQRADHFESLASQYALAYDSLLKAQPNPQEHVRTVLPRIPAGRTDRGLDSLRAILLEPPSQ